MKVHTNNSLGIQHWLVIVLWLVCTIILEVSLLSAASITNSIALFFAPISLVVIAILLQNFNRTFSLQTQEISLSRQAVHEVTLTMETIVNSIDAPIIMVSDDQRVSLVNQALEELLTQSKKELVGAKIRQLLETLAVETEHGLPVSVFLPDVFKGRSVEAKIVTIGALEKENYYLLSLNPIEDKDSGKRLGVIMLFRDITELKILDQMKDEFIGVVSHELKTPLAVIKSFSQLELVLNEQRRDRLKELAGKEIPDGLLAPSAERNCLDKIVSEVDLMTEMIDQMVQATRIDSGKYQLNPIETDLVPLTQEVVSDFKLSLGADRLQLEHDPQTQLFVRVDPNAYKQVLMNLISNAAKYSPDNSLITISLTPSFEKKKVHLKVSDQGIGIPLSDQQSIFSKFYRTSNSKNVSADGLGLGLYISSRLIELLGGKIGVESEVNQGSTFTVSLPLLPAETS